MEATRLKLDNIKCGGCEKTIQKILLELEGVKNVEVDSNEGAVSFQYQEKDTPLSVITARLTKAGYPPEGESSLGDKAKSYVSCMKGRIS